ncbi:MAG: mannose-1-phosphate guanylyltransferase/mannose-6-phosphate isomerase [Desulfuromonadales bacterium]|nr:mannose-1-phosphate guanylyltransferase/mannose-6-phosphate isomerase [Desulfuromonadales bacterium]MDW7756845.1 mannose-1-phosphate guanylyltransferase/mannose-6-phosphate isomerase [Desulfuromonadales bacterium]
MIVPVILSGGAGTRLWPLSRELYPKQLLPLVSARTMLQETVERLNGLPELSPAMVICNENHRFMVAEQMRQSSVPTGAIVLEPVGRNTAPAIAAAALLAQAKGDDPVLLVLPADHVIAEAAVLRQAIKAGAALAEQGRMVTFGIVPDKAETGYGYIRAGEPLECSRPLSFVTCPLSKTNDPKPMTNDAAQRLTNDPEALAAVAQRLTNDTTAFAVAAFVEKPDLATAEEYLASGDYYWNSGMFLFKASRYLEELEKFAPSMLAACRLAVEQGQKDLDFLRLDAEAFAACPADSIDYAVMEKTDAAAVIPLDAGWNDVGSWSALWEVGAHDPAGNILKGDVLAEDVKNSYIHASQRLVAAVGVEDHVIVETADAVLVAPKDRVQDVKHIVERLKAQNRAEALLHRRVNRPWGAYECIDQAERYQVKHITVHPGATLSLQMHHHRAEHWIVVRGTAKVTKGEEVILLSENQSTYIPLGVTHRLENVGKIPLEMIEVQSGSYLGEDDIVRFDDEYGRG